MSTPLASGRLLLLLLLLLSGSSCISDRGAARITGEVIDCQVPLAALRAGGHIVLIRGSTFIPDTVRARQGDRVTWVNCEPAPGEAHTSTASSDAWSSPLLAPGAWFTAVMSSAGESAYFCVPHPFMRGVVIVD